MATPAPTTPPAAPPPAPPAVPPTAPGRLLLGSAADLRRRQLATQVRAMRELGDVVRFVLGPPGLRLSLVAVYGPEGVHHVLAAASGRYRKDNRFYDELRGTFGDGLLTSQDATWQRQKRFVQPLFTHARVHEYVPAMAEEAEALVQRWAAPARSGEPVELHGESTHVTLRVVGRALFGADVDTAAELIRSQAPVLTDQVLRRGFAPVRVPASWPTPANRRAARARRALDALLDDLVAQRRRSGTPAADLVGRLVAARDGSAESAPGARTALDDAEVRDQLLVFLLAGHDTTATTLMAALHLLGHSPEVQERAAAEARGVLSGPPRSAAELAQLPYTTMVVKEALRLYPPAFAVGRRLTGGDDVVAGYRVADGSDVVVYPWATHRHPRHWDEPERFDPERFTPEREAARHRYAWFPFGGGPRTCIGGHFALLEAVTVLVTVLRAYRVETPDRPIAVLPRITLQPAGSVPCRLSPRG